VINRLAPGRGIHLEQSAKARVFHEEIAGAVGSVFASPWRRRLWTLLSIFQSRFGRKPIDQGQGGSLRN
jgi:hypothetical protein